MAIYGAGSVWSEGEQIEDFFKDNKFVLGWGHEYAEDLYALISSVKVGDIIYIKSKSPSSHNINIKAIGIVTETAICRVINGKIGKLTGEGQLSLGVKWIKKESFEYHIEEASGKLTSIRASTFYEEFLPSIQSVIINHLFQ